MGTAWSIRTKELADYLAARSARGGSRFRRTHTNPKSGLYVLWVENESNFRVRDFQRTPKTEILPRACSVKAGRYDNGFFNRRDLDDTQLHVRAGVPQALPLWRRNRAGHWLVFRQAFREIASTDGGANEEARLLGAVRSWLTANSLLILPAERAHVVATNNAHRGLEPISSSDFPAGEWMHVHRFDAQAFRDLVSHVESVGIP